MSHTPGAEVSGTRDEISNQVAGSNKGDIIIIHNNVFDGKCDMCLSGVDMICRNSGRIV